MRVLVNGDWREISCNTLALALQELGYGDGAFATALNGEVVPSGERARTTLRDSDRLEVLAPMQGG